MTISWFLILAGIILSSLMVKSRCSLLVNSLNWVQFTVPPRLCGEWGDYALEGLRRLRRRLRAVSLQDLECLQLGGSINDHREFNSNKCRRKRSLRGAYLRGYCGHQLRFRKSISPLIWRKICPAVWENYTCIAHNCRFSFVARFSDTEYRVVPA